MGYFIRSIRSNDRLTGIIVLIFFGCFLIGLGILGYISGDEKVRSNFERKNWIFDVINWMKENLNDTVVLFVFAGLGLWCFYRAILLIKGRKKTG